LKGISETLIVPLWGRAVKTKRPNHIIKDYKAVEIMEHIEYDFSKFDIREMPQISIISERSF
jgi:O-methyltransferase involved in polyketide biosynthesis